MTRSAVDPKLLVPQINRAVGEVDPNLAIFDFSTLAEVVDRSMATQKLIAQLSVLFAILAALLASVGIYGVMSYGIARRTNEFGIRMALGAHPTGALWMVLGAVAGVAIGIALTLACGRLVESELFGLKPWERPEAVGSAGHRCGGGADDRGRRSGGLAAGATGHSYRSHHRLAVRINFTFVYPPGYIGECACER
ncbi:hypothetical protein SBA3_1020008 [Candidatus Sulfopaludibacter sp. SbA3]|nr:hypothetical protein SBA3_1020008 [Candidatus Sulfopaludibacter sp. SbA3]